MRASYPVRSGMPVIPARLPGGISFGELIHPDAWDQGYVNMVQQFSTMDLLSVHSQFLRQVSSGSPMHTEHGAWATHCLWAPCGGLHGVTVWEWNIRWGIEK